MRPGWLKVIALCGLMLGALTPTVAPAAAISSDPAVVGAWGQPFEEPGAHCATSADGTVVCKPAGASMVQLADGRVLYWNALEGTEAIQTAAVPEGAARTVNDQVRVLSMKADVPSWARTTPGDGGANPGGGASTTDCLVPGTCTYPGKAYGDLFCADQVLLGNGDVLAIGGTAYYNDPGVPGTNYGVLELQGLAAARIFHPSDNTWTQTGKMNYGRWYPSMVTLPNGKVFVASGVTKLIKPVYPSSPSQSGTNVKQTETYDPVSGKFTTNAASADRSLPLYPRLHLLPDGKILYDAGGQTYNPQGQSYDEVLWNLESIYDPATQAWTDLGIPRIGTSQPGFRGSGFSQALVMKAPYTSMSFLSAGGVLGTTPGTVVATPTSSLTTIETAGGQDRMTDAVTTPLNNARWYSTGVVIPDGTVLAFSGATSDEVVGPGNGMPIRQAEMFNPDTRAWTPLAEASHGRTYHNTAMLMPDGRVLVGGHAPIPTDYGSVQTIPGGFSSNDRDPSFEIFSPPYLFRGKRPAITAVSADGGYNQPITIHSPDAPTIQSVVLSRNTALTHLVDGDQRTIDLPIVSRTADTVTVISPPTSAVAPAGPYLLFALGRTPKGPTPSVAAQVFMGSTRAAFVYPPTAPSAAADVARAPAVLPNTSVGITGIAGFGLVAVPGLVVAMLVATRRRRARVANPH
ncbi:MAG: hypothetical protein NVSMB17_00240 [Candidatus Dormibacteria bacterium]